MKSKELLLSKYLENMRFKFPVEEANLEIFIETGYFNDSDGIFYEVSIKDTDDDINVSGVFNKDMIKELIIFLQFAIALEDAE